MHKALFDRLPARALWRTSRRPAMTLTVVANPVGRAAHGRRSKSRNKVSVGEPAEGSLESLVFCRDPRAQYRVREPSVGVPCGPFFFREKRAGSKARELLCLPSRPASRSRAPVFRLFVMRRVLVALIGKKIQLLTVDPSARASMKNAASCDT